MFSFNKAEEDNVEMVWAGHFKIGSTCLLNAAQCCDCVTYWTCSILLFNFWKVCLLASMVNKRRNWYYFLTVCLFRNLQEALYLPSAETILNVAKRLETVKQIDWLWSVTLKGRNTNTWKIHFCITRVSFTFGESQVRCIPVSIKLEFNQICLIYMN